MVFFCVALFPVSWSWLLGSDGCRFCLESVAPSVGWHLFGLDVRVETWWVALTYNAPCGVGLCGLLKWV